MSFETFIAKFVDKHGVLVVQPDSPRSEKSDVNLGVKTKD